MTPGDIEFITASELSPRDGRTLLFYLLYALETFDYEVSLESIVDNFSRGFKIIIDLEDELVHRARSIIIQRHTLDLELEPLLSNWRLDRLGWCTRLILRMALWELKNTDIPPIIIINEAIELAKNFGELESYKFINGVLDEWVRRNKPETLETQKS